ncbi:MAG: hypothetical protein EOO01_34760 [Chitinophagaceae bacterium]|nr:MAG: hypothetical protein EOO01_34760 [Chitinophagaceae bacterium]
MHLGDGFNFLAVLVENDLSSHGHEVNILLIFFLQFIFIQAHAQDQKKSILPCEETNIPHYTAYKISDTVVPDGKLEEKCWRNIERSTRFKDLVSGDSTHLDTRAAVCWDEQNLYVGFWVEEPYLQARHTKRDAPIYEDNDVELFIAGKDGYYEFEINSFGTIYEVMFFWMDAYEKNNYHKMPAFRKDVPGARIFNGVGYRHPSGKRIGFWQWDMPGLKSGVHFDGTMNDDNDKDKGWTVEIAETRGRVGVEDPNGHLA